jgi:gliding motility-associated-like protein
LNYVVKVDSVFSLNPAVNATYLTYGLSDTSYVAIKVFSPPDFSIGNDTIMCLGITHTLSSPYFNETTLWNDTTNSPQFSTSQSGTYWVEMTYNSCLLRDTITIIFEDCEVQLRLPNLFTPNNDGTNEQFMPILSKGIKSMNTKIYNRWGDRIFESSDLLIGWDGGNCSDGIYYWWIDYTDRYNNSNALKGYVHLLR